MSYRSTLGSDMYMYSRHINYQYKMTRQLEVEENKRIQDCSGIERHAGKYSVY